MQHQPLAPVATHERILTIDIIRGFALLGIVIINFTVDAIDINLKNGFGDQLVYWTVRLFMDDRFQAIYCFLFGLGFALQMQRAAARNTFFGFAYLRRMIALYLITIAVFILTADGYPVLPHYAMTGVLLLLFWKVPLKFLPFLALLFYFLSQTKDIIVNMRAEHNPVAININAVDTTLHIKADTVPPGKHVGKPTLISYAEFVKKNITKYGSLQKRWGRFDMVLKQLGYMLGYILVLFLLGMYAGKRKIFQDTNANKAFLRKVFKWGMIIGSPGILFDVGYQAWRLFNGIDYSDHSLLAKTLMSLSWDVGIFFTAMAIIAGLTLILENPVWKKRLSFFVPVGRLGLTNYILLLFANMILFKNASWFFALKAGCFLRILIAIAFFITLYFLSKSWLKYFRQGLFEWLWRSLTYLKFQPMRQKLTNPSG